MKKYMLLLYLLVLFMICVGCSNNIEDEAKVMLKKYNLHSDGEFNKVKMVFQDYPDSPGIITDVSKDIGLDLTEVEGQKVNFLSCLLKERSQGGSGKIYAHFVENDNKIVGAYLSLDGYAPGIVSLNDRSNFAPKKLILNNLEFYGINKISISGPFERDVEREGLEGEWRWKNQITIEDSAEIDRFTSLLGNSKTNKGWKSGNYKDEQYLIILHYSDGPVLRVRMTTFSSNSETVITYDFNEFYGYHCIPNEELVSYIRVSLNY